MSGSRESNEWSSQRLDALPEPDRHSLYARARELGACAATLQRQSWAELRHAAALESLHTLPNASADQLRAALLFARARRVGIGLASGILDVSPDGFGFLRSQCANFAAGADDVYVSGGQLAHLGLRHGSFVEGPLRPPREGEQFASLLRVEHVDGLRLRDRQSRIPFEQQAPVLPTQPLLLAPAVDDLALRMIARLSPWAHGHRVLVWAPEQTARALLLARMGTAMRGADSAIAITLCLLDAEPLAVDRARSILRTDDVLAATYDEAPSRQLQTAELALAAAERRAECGARSVLLIDSMDALARAGQREKPRPGRLGPHDIATHALQRQKRMFAAARQLDGGGSLTTVFTMSPRGDLPIEREAASMFRNKGNAAVAFDTLADGELPCPRQTRTRSEDLLLHRTEREEQDRMRTRIAAAEDGERRRVVAEWLEAHG